MKKIILISIAVLTVASVSALAFWGYQQLTKSNSSTTQSQSPSNTFDTVLSDNTQVPTSLSLQSQGAAPDFKGANGWINSEPLTIEALKNKVVLVHFWTYSSIQSIKMTEWLNKMYSKYSGEGLAIIGVHTPQYNFEKAQAGAESAVKRYSITYPVVLDNNYKIWQAYQNTFWPTSYLVNKEGQIVFSSIGEDQLLQIEQAIKMLVGLEGDAMVTSPAVKVTLPNLNLGLIKLSRFGGVEKPSSKEQIFVFPKKLAKDKFALEGKWSFSQESAMHTQGFGRLRLNFTAQKVSAVAKSTSPMPVKIFVDGKLSKAVVIEPADNYELFNSEEAKARTLELEIPRGGLEIFSFSFE